MANATHTSDFYGEMMQWLATFAHRSLEDFHRFTRDAGLTMLQMNVLMRLHYRGACEMNGLIDTMLTSKAAVSQMVDRLIQLGLVERAESLEDRRAKMVSLTRAGQKIVADSIRAREQWLQAVGGRLTEQQKAQIAQALHVLVEVSAQADEATPNTPVRTDSKSAGRKRKLS
jgi:DNA-binding MarR family transcriptional regulator